MADAKALYESMVALCAEKIPGFEVRFKTEHFKQKLTGFVLRWVVPFNREYMTRYTTTLYPVIYFPSREWLEKNYMNAFRVLAHEYVHLWDEKDRGFSYKLSYMFPQFLGLLALLAFLAFLWKPALWALVCLVFLAPLPALGRRNIELRGYLMSMAISYWRHGNVQDRQLEHTADQFTKSFYYWMWPFRKAIMRILRGFVEDLEAGKVIGGKKGGPYMDVRAILAKHGELAA